TLREEIVAHGGNADRVFSESFHASFDPVETPDCASVHFASSGVTAVWHAASKLSLLELGERAGLSLASDCRAGSCLTCRVVLREGHTTAETGAGATLLCTARP